MRAQRIAGLLENDALIKKVVEQVPKRRGNPPLTLLPNFEAKTKLLALQRVRGDPEINDGGKSSDPYVIRVA